VKSPQPGMDTETLGVPSSFHFFLFFSGVPAPCWPGKDTRQGSMQHLEVSRQMLLLVALTSQEVQAIRTMNRQGTVSHHSQIKVETLGTSRLSTKEGWKKFRRNGREYSMETLYCGFQCCSMCTR